jgi:hypothetical protein
MCPAPAALFPAAVRLPHLLAGGALALLLLAAFTAWYFLPVSTVFRLSTAQGGPPVRLVLVTDLHSGRYGKGQRGLVRRIERLRPDAVLLGGDIFDDRLPDGNTLAFLDAAAARWKCFYVTGNHEYWSGRHREMKALVRARGISVLAGTCATLECRGRLLDICGIDDPTYMLPGEWHPPLPPSLPAEDPTCRTGGEWHRQLDAAQAAARPGRTRILLSHRPEYAAKYKGRGFDLVLAGHAHGGQVALPFGLLPGLYSPGEGYFPKYVSGPYDLGDGTMLVVSRGLSRRRHPLPRWFNHPEVVAIDLA